MDSLRNASIWDLGLPATPADMSNENIDYGLCDMVRASYLDKLRETLMANLSGNVLGDREMYVAKCMGEMEKEALRRCMVAKIYCEEMRKMINEVNECTGTSTIHDRLMTTIIAQSDSSYAERETASMMKVTAVDIDERQQNFGGDVDLVSFPTQAQVFDQRVEQDIVKLAINNFQHTSMYPGSITENIVDPSIVRPEVISIIKKEKGLSDKVATTYEFRRNMESLPQAMRDRVDEELNRMFGSYLDPWYRPMFLSKEEERIISYDRIMRLVSNRMKPYFDLRQITNSSDFDILVQLISKTMMDSASDPTESTVNQIIDGFFFENPYKSIDQFVTANSYFFERIRLL